MPLSDEELRLLEQMERALVAEDPKFASALRGSALQRHARRRSLLAGLVFLVGVAVLMTGAVMAITVIGIVGFVVMLVSAYVALSSWKGQQAASASEGTQAVQEPTDSSFGLSVIEGGKAGRSKKRRPRPARGRTSGSMMERFEERWRRRRDGNGGI